MSEAGSMILELSQHRVVQQRPSCRRDHRVDDYNRIGKAIEQNRPALGA